MERFLSGEHLLLHEQHPAARRRNASRRIPIRPHPDAQSVHGCQRLDAKGESRADRGRCAGRPDGGAVGQGARPEVFVANQGQAGLLRGQGRRRVHGRREAGRVPAGDPGRGAVNRRKDHRGFARPRSRPQGPGNDTPQDRTGCRRSSRQACRLPGEGSPFFGAVRGGGRLRRRVGQAGSGPALSGDPSAQGEDSERGEGPIRQDAVVGGGGDAHHRARLRYRAGRVRPGKASLPSHHHHDRCRYRRLAHPHAAAYVLLPAYVRTYYK